jgi:hypothetical protein
MCRGRRSSLKHKLMSPSERKRLKRLRDKAAEKQNHCCFWCEVELNNIENHQFCCSADHLIELRDGGTTCEENIVASCKRCNDTRSDYTRSDWEEIIKLSKETHIDLSIIRRGFNKDFSYMERAA